jgi:hypothetical protein
MRLEERRDLAAEVWVTGACGIQVRVAFGWLELKHRAEYFINATPAGR